MTPVFSEVIDCNSAADFLKELTPWSSSRTLQGYIFRGHEDDGFQLIPSALRLEKKSELIRAAGLQPPDPNLFQHDFWQSLFERSALRRFFKYADRSGLYVPNERNIRENINDWADIPYMAAMNEQTWISAEFLELAGLAQHYGVPTRLLDWSYDPLVAAYFASLNGGSDGHISVWCLHMAVLLDDKHSVGGAPIEFVTPYYGGNPNLSAQAGVFTHWRIKLPNVVNLLQGGQYVESRLHERSLDDLLLETFSASGRQITHNIFIKFRLPKARATEVRKLLRDAGYAESRLFPGYAGVAKEILAPAFEQG